jgi:hypothetical protein
MKNSSYLSAYEDGTECSETSGYKIQTPGNYPEESIQHSEKGESLKSIILKLHYDAMKNHSHWNVYLRSCFRFICKFGSGSGRVCS